MPTSPLPLLATIVVVAAGTSGPTDTADNPVNATCPIGKEPIVASAGTVRHDGHAIGLCCPGCGEAFLAWTEARKDAFVERALAGSPAADPAAADDPPEAGRRSEPDASPTAGGRPGPTYPYPLPDCPVGGPLGSMGDPVVRVYENREVRFCCAGCIGAFEADPAKYWAEIDAAIAEQQRLHYPVGTCIATGRPLDADAVDHVHNNRLVRLADGDALAAFIRDPGRYLEALDRRIVQLQRPGYPMEDCPVGGRLGSMGEPVDFVFMNRLVRLCCAGCRKGLTDDPAPHLAKLDAAYAERQRADAPRDTCVVSGAALGSMGEPVEVVAGTRLIRLCCDACLPALRKSPLKYLDELPDAAGER